MDISRRLFYASLIVLWLTGTTVLWGDVIGLALFLQHAGIKALPLALILEGLLSIITITGIERLKSRFHDGMMIALLCLLGMVGIGLGWLFSDQGYETLGFGTYYLVRRLLRDLLSYYIWHYVASYYDIGVRYLLPRLSLANRAALTGSMGVLIVLTFTYSPAEMITIWFASLVITLVAVGIFADEFMPVTRPGTSTESLTAHARLSTVLWGMLRSDLMIMLSAGTFAAIFLSSLAFYLSSQVYLDLFTSETRLLQWFAALYTVTGLVSIPIYYGALPYASQQLSLPRLASVFPGVLGVSFASLLALPALLTALLADLSRISVQISLFEPIFNQMKQTLPTSVRIWERTIIDGVMEPGARIVAGLFLLLVLAGLPSVIVLFVGLLVMVGLGYTQYRGALYYNQALKKSLAAGQYGFLRTTMQEQLNTSDEIVRRLLQQLHTIHPGDRNLLLIVQALAESGSQAGFEAVMQLWARCPTSIQAELLLQILEGWSQQRRSEVVRVLVTEALESDHTELRRAALRAMISYPRLLDPYRVARYLIDPEPEVSTLSAQLLLLHSSHKLSKAARAQLNWLSRSGHAATRALAVTALVHGGVNRFGERIISLDQERFLSDPAARVRLAFMPGADLPALLQSVQDVSPSVRQMAMHRLMSFRLRAVSQLRDNLSRLPQHSQQFDQLLHRWHLLTAIGQLSPPTGRQLALAELQAGMQQVDFLTSVRANLRQFKYPSLVPLLTQLSSDRAQLIQGITDFLGRIYGERIYALIRTLQLQTNTAESAAAVQVIAEITTSQLSQQLNLLVSRPNDEDFYLTIDRTYRVDNPVKAVHTLLMQPDEWRPLLTLYALSALPRPIYQALATPEQVEVVLDNARKCQEEAVREGARLLARALKETNPDPEATKSISLLSRVMPRRHEETSHMLSTIERMLFLRNVSFFENLRLDQLRTLARICVEQAFNAGEYVIRKGEVGDSLFIIVEGQIEVVASTADGRRGTVLAAMKAGDVLGEISIFDRGVRSADAIANTECLLLVVHREALDDALADDPGIAMDMLRVMAQRIRQSNLAVQEMSKQLSPQVQDAVS